MVKAILAAVMTLLGYITAESEAAAYLKVEAWLIANNKEPLVKYSKDLYVLVDVTEVAKLEDTAASPSNTMTSIDDLHTLGFQSSGAESTLYFKDITPELEMEIDILTGQSTLTLHDPTRDLTIARLNYLLPSSLEYLRQFVTSLQEVTLFNTEKPPSNTMTLPLLLNFQDNMVIGALILTNEAATRLMPYVVRRIRFGLNFSYRSWPFFQFLAAGLVSAPAENGIPIPMILHCPACGKQHIDAPEGDEVYERRFEQHIDTCRSHTFPCESFVPRWTNPPHKSHLCHNCGIKWRPADTPTVGVAAVQTRGSGDTWPI